MTSPDLAEAGRSETVGKPIDGVEVAIIDEREAALPDGTEGEVAVRGFNVMQGYFRQPAATQAALTSDGYLKTGDLGMIDAEGYLRIVGRKRDLIIRGGYSVHPREVEDHLRSLPAVADAMVVGIPNEVLGELVCACVIPVEGALVTEDEIRQLCRPGLAEYKLPDVVHFVDELPKASSGSPRRAELARKMRLELARRDEEPAG
jgi:fatty-acyl-CoA synthase